MKKKSKFKSKTIIIDFVLFAILIAFALIEKLYLYKIIDCCFYKKLPKIPIFIEILLPTTITIISISLSLSKEKMYGASMNEINRIRGNFYFSFLHSSIIMCFLFLCFGLLNYFEAKISLYLLSFITLIYCLYFLIQEISLITKPNKAISRIIKYYYKNRKLSYSWLENENEISYKIVQNMILTEGIAYAYDIISEKNNKVDSILFLLGIQNRYLNNLKDDLMIKDFSLINKEDLSILSIVKKCYENIIEILENQKFINLKVNDKDEITYFARSLFHLHEICKITDAYKIESKHIDEIIINYLVSCYGGKQSSIAEAVIVIMCIDTLIEGEIWFIKEMRNISSPFNDIFNFDKCAIGIFVTMIINHIENRHILDSENNSKIKNFLKEKNKCINSDGNSWMDDLEKSIELTNSDKIINSINLFLRYYNSLDFQQYNLRTKNRFIGHSPEDYFREIDIFDQWIEILILNTKYNGEKSDASQIIDKLNTTSKDWLYKILKEKWITNGNFDINKSFIVNNNFNEKNTSFNKNNVDYYEKCFNEFVEFYNTKRI